MFLDFYGLREQPFGVTPDPRYFYPSASHRKAFESLIRGVQYQIGFALLIAEPGMGKTTLLFDLLKTHRTSAETAFIFNTQCTPHEFLRELLHELRITTVENDMVRLQSDFKLFVIDRARTKPILLVIDEAQNLSDSVLETIRILSNFETPKRKLLHIILSGQPQLADNIRQPHLLQLMQRITLVDRLERIPSAEIDAYIRHRLRIAGHDGSPLFSPEAVAKIDLQSGGIPRSINRLCFNALIAGADVGAKELSGDIIDQVADDLDLGFGAGRNRTKPNTAMRHGTTAEANTSATTEIADDPNEKPCPPKLGEPCDTELEMSRTTPEDKKPAQLEHPNASDAPRLQTLAGMAERSQEAPAKPRPQRNAYLSTLVVSVALLLSAALVVSAQIGEGQGDAWLALEKAKSRGVELFEQMMNEHGEELTTANGPAIQTTAPTPTAGVQQKSPDGDVTRPTAPRNKAAQTSEGDAAGNASAPVSRRALPPSMSTVTVTASSEVPIAEHNGSPHSAVPSATSTSPDSPQQADPAVLASHADIESHVPTTMAPNIAVPSKSPATDPSPTAPRTNSTVLLHSASVSGKNRPQRSEPMRLVKLIRPEYPESARAAGIEGDVFLAVTVGNNGVVQQVQVNDGNPMLAMAAVEAVKQWRYAPSYTGNSAASSEFSVMVQFKFQ